MRYLDGFLIVGQQCSALPIEATAIRRPMIMTLGRSDDPSDVSDVVTFHTGPDTRI